MIYPRRRAVPALVCLVALAAASLVACSGTGVLEAGPTGGDAGTWPPRPSMGGGDLGSDAPDFGLPPLPPVDPWLQVEAPLDGAVTDAERVRVEGSAGGVEAVQINGRDVTLRDGRFSSNVALEEGRNEIVVEVPGQREVRNVLRDSRAPAIVLSTPERGRMQPLEGAPADVLVEGSAWDEGVGVDQVTIDGVPVELSLDGRFRGLAHPPAGGSTLLVEATDFLGHRAVATRSMLRGRFTDPAPEVPDALAIWAGPSAFDALEPVIVQQILSQGLDQALAAQGSGDFEIRYIRYGQVDLDLRPDVGALHASVSVHDLEVGFRTEQRIVLIDVTFTGDASADRVDLDTRIVIEATEPGGVAVRLENTTVQLHGFEVDIDDFPGFLEDLLRGTIESMAENAIEDALADLVLSDLFGPEVLHQELALAGRTLALDLKVRDVDVQPTGMRAQLGIVATPQRLEGVPASLGALDDPVPLPAPGRGPGNVEGLLADDAGNRLLHAAWQAGLLHQTLDPSAEGAAQLPMDLTVRTLDGLAGGAFGALLDPATPLALRTEALLPPVLRPGAQGEPALHLFLGDLLLHFDALPAEGGPVPLLSIAVAADVDVDLSVDESGALAPTFAVRSLADLDAEPLVDVVDEQVEAFVGQLIAVAVPLLTQDLVQIPDPLVEGLRLSAPSFSADPGGGYLRLDASLEPAAP